MARSPSESEVHEALDALGDGVMLGQARLASFFPPIEAIAPLNERARRLRALLLEAIELLCPPRRLPFGSSESRPYDVLTLRYVERMSVVDMGEELSLSRRQVHRDLKQAEQRLTELLASWAGREEAGESQGSDSLSEELAVFSHRPAEVRLAAVVGEALALVKPLADSLRIGLSAPAISDAALSVVADRAFLGQLLVQALSVAVQSARPGSVAIAAELAADGVQVLLRLRTSEPQAFGPRVESLRRLAQAEGIACRAEVSASGEARLVLGLPQGGPVRVLVVEDNPGAVELYRRYLVAGDYQLQAISDPRLAHDTVLGMRPHVVVLDVMMPHRDGWTVLRALKTDPRTADVPVIICSVVEDPALAGSLGAAACLSKPVSRSELLTALQRCLHPAALR